MNTRMQQKLNIAIGRIVTREPFFASILLGKAIIEDPSIPTFATNGIIIKYNSAFAAKLSEEELIGVLCHEVEHIARLHPWRRQGRDLGQWNKATDFVINEELIAEKFSLPEGALIDSTFNGLAEEQIYSKIAPTDAPGNGPGQGQGNAPQGPGQGPPQPGQGTPSNDPSDFGSVEDCPGTDAEQQTALAEAKVEILRAAQVAKSQGKLPGSMASYVDEIKHPKIPWQDVLRDYLTAYARDDYSWSKPNRRYADSEFVLPSLANFRCGTIAIAGDSSGSVGAIEFAHYIGALRDIIEAMKPERIIWIQCDAEIQDYQVLDNPSDIPDKMQVLGGGGTSFIPVFERIESEGEEPACLVYLTDAHGDFPDQAPTYPVLWAVTTTKQVPFGNRIQIDL